MRRAVQYCTYCSGEASAALYCTAQLCALLAQRTAVPHFAVVECAIRAVCLSGIVFTITISK